MDFSALGQAAAQSEDLTVSKSFEREVPKAGVALLRLKDYIETGRHEPRDPTFKPALQCMLTFELSHPNHLVEIDGKKVPQNITIRLNKGSSNKSGYRKLFNVMNLAHGGTSKHFVELIGKAFLGTIYHNKSKDGKTTYANLDLDGAWSLKAPEQIDALTEVVTPIPVRELDGKPKVFLWEYEHVTDAQVQEMWNSIYIEGTREVEKDGVKEKVSKNWIQELIMSNTEWEGSTTQALTQEHISIDAPADVPVVATTVTDLAAASDSPVPSLND